MEIDRSAQLDLNRSMASMSLRQYAKSRGVALSSVQLAIKTGRIDVLPDGKLDSEAADRAWEERTISYPLRDDSVSVSQFARARGVREHFAARITKLEYEERTGKLVPVAEVQAAAFNRFRQFRDAMISIPDRTAAMLAAESDEGVCHGILRREIEKALAD